MSLFTNTPTISTTCLDSPRKSLFGGTTTSSGLAGGGGTTSDSCGRVRPLSAKPVPDSLFRCPPSPARRVAPPSPFARRRVATSLFDVAARDVEGDGGSPEGTSPGSPRLGSAASTTPPPAMMAMGGSSSRLQARRRNGSPRYSALERKASARRARRNRQRGAGLAIIVTDCDSSNSSFASDFELSRLSTPTAAAASAAAAGAPVGAASSSGLPRLSMVMMDAADEHPASAATLGSPCFSLNDTQETQVASVVDDDSFHARSPATAAAAMTTTAMATTTAANNNTSNTSAGEEDDDVFRISSSFECSMDADPLMQWREDLGTPPQHRPMSRLPSDDSVRTPPQGDPAAAHSMPTSPHKSPIPFPQCQDGFLRLRDGPHTPRSLVSHHQAGMARNPSAKSRARMLAQPSAGRANGSSSNLLNPNYANENPFTPKMQVKRSRRSPTSGDETLDDSLEHNRSFDSPLKRTRHRLANISRYSQEFIELGVLGTGEFGTVFKCKNRLDGTLYAIKKSKRPIAGLADEQYLLREVYAHAVLEVQPHIVRYYSAWEEDNHMIIQSEFCDGGSLEDAIEKHKVQGSSFTRNEIRKILHHITLGLKAMHAQRLAHLDIKPGNIFLKTEVAAPPETPTTPQVDEDDVFAAMDVGQAIPGPDAALVTYKVGDLGLVSRLDQPNVEEGDCRYMAKELLNDDHSRLRKADIFSMAVTIFECATLRELPKNGPEWHQLRSGEALHLPRLSSEMNSLLTMMLSPEPELRPSADVILKHPALVEQRKPALSKTKTQLAKELNAQKLQNRLLERRLLASGGGPAAEPAAEAVARPSSVRGGRSFCRSSSVSW